MERRTQHDDAWKLQHGNAPGLLRKQGSARIQGVSPATASIMTEPNHAVKILGAPKRPRSSGAILSWSGMLETAPAK